MPLKMWRLGLVTCAVLVAAPPPTADAEVFTISGVAVDETAEDTRQARMNALRSALHIAWRDLARRLVRGDPEAILDQDVATLDTLVQSLEFDDERMSAGRYQAVISVRFQADAVLEILGDSGVSHLDTPGPVLVVLPVLQTGPQLVLWEDSNVWLSAWQRSNGGSSAVELIVPPGDLRDISLIDAADALSQDWSQLAGLVSRHRADGVLIAHARKDMNTLRPRLTWLDEDGANPVLMGRSVPQMWPMDALGGAVEASRTGIDEHWAAMALAPDGPTVSVFADIPVTSLAEWIDIRDRLESAPAVQAVVPLLVSTTRIRARMLYTGTREDLLFRMRRAGLEVDGQAGLLTIGKR
ncbi:MAG: DUF2066 domain-containing protein [Alphaproteobacteria bacterium]|nr:DUF2066 domain-containing protein [Alphaproteobacteria bacterium]